MQELIVEADRMNLPLVQTFIDEQLEEAGCERKIMLLDWNRPKDAYHSIVQEAMAHRSVRAGADLVIGNGEGCLQGVDLVEDVPVIYSLGDLLNGSVSEKPKKQQGILARAVFSFGGNPGLNVTIIPLLPYGGGNNKQNEYVPVLDLTREQSEQTIRLIRQDATDRGMDGFQFYQKDQ